MLSLAAFRDVPEAASALDRARSDPDADVRAHARRALADVSAAPDVRAATPG